MKKAPRNRKRSAARRTRAAGRRSDSALQWPQTLDQVIAMMLMGGASPAQIRRQVAKSLHARRKTKAVKIPPPEVLEYARIITYWRNERRYLDDRGQPRSIPFEGRGASFKSLARSALPGTDAEDVLAVLLKYEILERQSDRRIRLLTNAFLPQNDQRPQFVAYTLMALDGMANTCYQNLTARRPAERAGYVQRIAYAEFFDAQYEKEYDAYLKDETDRFLHRHDTWLKRHEVTPARRRRARAIMMGVGIFGIRARKRTRQ